MAFRECFGAPRALIGVLHVGALPGTPAASQSIDTLIRQMLEEASIYRDAGFSALILENMHDRPYLKGGVGPEITAAMTALTREAKRDSAVPEAERNFLHELGVVDSSAMGCFELTLQLFPLIVSTEKQVSIDALEIAVDVFH